MPLGEIEFLINVNALEAAGYAETSVKIDWILRRYVSEDRSFFVDEAVKISNFT